MPKIKIVYTEGFELGYYDMQQVIRDMTDWEDVTDEEEQLIRKHVFHLPKPKWASGLTPHVVSQDDRPIAAVLPTIRDIVRLAEEKARLYEMKKAEAKKKQLLSKQEKMQKEFERLKQALGEASGE